MQRIHQPDRDVRGDAVRVYASKIMDTALSQRSESARSSRDKFTHDTFGREMIVNFLYLSHLRVT